MSTRVADRVDGWDQRSFAGGYRGLQELADADFSGVVRAGGVELYMTKGTVVGVEGGTIEDFEDASGPARRAPSPALPLLAVMQSRGDEVRARYYTEDTPMSEVDSTLSDGGFTGYVELSENVLSGDYYLVYHRGRSMSVAFVGNSSRLIDGDEAFRTADDEVGIYEVRPAAVDAIDIPEPEPDAAATPDPEPESGPGGATGAAGAAAGAGAASGADPAPSPDESPPEESDAARTEESAAVGDDEHSTGGSDRAANTAEAATDDRSEAGAGPTEPGGRHSPAGEAAREPEPPSSEREPDGPDQPGVDPAAGDAEADNPHPSPDQAARVGRTGEPREQASGADPPAEAGDTRAEPANPGSEAGRTRPPEPQSPSSHTETATAGEGGSGQASGPGGASGDAGGTLETRSVPSLDPELTTQTERSSAGAGTTDGQSAAGGNTAGAGQSAGPGGSRTPEAGPRPEPPQEGRDRPTEAAGAEREAASAEPPQGSGSGRDTGGSTGTVGSDDAAVAELRERLEEREEAIERLEAELEEETGRREQLEADLADIREERDDLAAEVDRLESELERVEEEFGVAAGANRRLTAAEALEGTDLFVRYRSKNDTTLADIHDGEGSREELTGNLRLEQHTQFDADEVAVEGKEYGAFVRERVEYQFVTWLVEDLLFEVRDTGQTGGLSDLYDALPDVDRAELNGTVAVRYTEDGEEHRGQETFDIVLRDRMGNPLFLANLNDSRQGASEGMMEGLITAAERVGTSKDSLAGAFLVTESFFEPEALETAAEATKDGLLSRDSRKSFVNLSRKRGYHLCLVEARNQNFHLAVPEL